jgi:hypothetical protein
MFDTLYADRPYARFYVLETIARVPYFSASLADSTAAQKATDKSNLGGTLNCARACACLRAHQAFYLSCTCTRRWAGGVAATT